MAPFLSMPFFLSLILFMLLATTSRAEFIIHSWEDRFPQSAFVLGLNSDYFVTVSNFSNNGSWVTPIGLTSYAKLQSDLNFGIKLTNRIGLYGRGSWSYINLISNSKGGTGFGLGDQTAGVTFRITGRSPDDPLSLDLQAQADVPMYSNSASSISLTPLLGDGSIDITGGIFATLSIIERKQYKFLTVAGAGFTYRTDGFSAAVPWSVFFKLIPQLDGLAADLGFAGMLSMKTDTSFSRSNLVSGGSFITGAIDPSVLQLIVKPSFKFNPEMKLNLNGKVTLWGQNVPTGYSLALGLEVLLGTVPEGHIEKKLRANKPLETDPTGNDHPTFTTYSMDANIVKANNRLNLVKINKGSQDGIETGQVFDIFNIKVSNQGGEAIARARVNGVKLEEAALEITEFYKEVPIEEGYVAKRLIQ